MERSAIVIHSLYNDYPF